MKPTFEERLEALERVCFANGAQSVASIDPSSERIAEACRREVCRHYEVPTAWMRIRNRTKKVAFIRQVAMALSLELSGLPSQQVADSFNRRDHATVLHAAKVIKRWAAHPANYQVLQELRRRVVNCTKD